MNSLEEEVNGGYKDIKHDYIVKSLVDRLITSKLYDTIKHNVDYYNPYRGRAGEFDVIARAGDRYLAFEVKSSSRKLHKAGLQLDRDESYIKDCYSRDCRVYKFKVYSHKDKIVIKRSW